MDAKCSTDFPLRSASAMEQSNRGNRGPAKFGVSMLLAAAPSAALLLITVCIIVSLSPNKQMGWVCAGAVIARMENAFTFGDWAAIQNPRSTMSERGAHPQFAIAGLWRHATAPCPALTQGWIVSVHGATLGNMTPKDDGKIPGKTLRGEIFRRNLNLHLLSCIEWTPCSRLLRAVRGQLPPACRSSIASAI